MSGPRFQSPANDVQRVPRVLLVDESASTFIQVFHAVSNYWLRLDLLSSD